MTVVRVELLCVTVSPPAGQGGDVPAPDGALGLAGRPEGTAGRAGPGADRLSVGVSHLAGHAAAGAHHGQRTADAAQCTLVQGVILKH